MPWDTRLFCLHLLSEVILLTEFDCRFVLVIVLIEADIAELVVNMKW